MKSPTSLHSLQTKLSLRAPDKVEVPLVPLTTLQSLEFQFSWFTVFLSLCTTFLGAAVSTGLVANSWREGPWLLVFITAIFGVIAFIFCKSSIRTRNEILEMAEESQLEKYNEMFQQFALELYQLGGGQPVPILQAMEHIKAAGINSPAALVLDLERSELAERKEVNGVHFIIIRMENIKAA